MGVKFNVFTGQFDLVVDLISKLKDVNLSSLVDQDLLSWNPSNSKWENNQLNGASFKLMNFFNGTFVETFDARTSSDGSVVTLSIEQSGGGDLTMVFSDGFSTLDCTDPICTISLTPGTDTVPKKNYTFITKANKVLENSVVGFPLNEEHIKVAFTFLLDAVHVQSNGGALINQNWNDHASGTDNQGHETHMAEQARYQKGYFSGVKPNGTDQAAATSYFNSIALAEAYFKSTSGIMYQLHKHLLPAKDTQTGDTLHVVNWSGDAYHELTNLADIQADSTGSSLSNKYFNVFFFEVGNKTGEHDPVMAMLPSGSYVTQSAAENDEDLFDNLVMPREFNLDSSVGVSVCRMTLRWTGGFTTLSHISTLDLRVGGGTGGSGSSGATTFADNQFAVFSAADITKILKFDVGTNVSPGNIRTISIPDGSGEMMVSEIASTDNLVDVDTTTEVPVKNDVLMHNGDEFVPVPEGTTFTFSIASFVDNQSSQQEIGTGTWLAIGAIIFTATYDNGPTTSGEVQIVSGVSAWGSPLDMGGPNYTGPTASTEAVPYPASPGTTVRFRLSATDGTDPDTSDVTVVLNNRRFWGVSTTASGYTEADIEGLANNELSNSRAKTFTVTPGSSEYIIYSYPNRLGTATFTVGGFEGGFESPETVSVTNASGFTEDYYVYRSTNPNLGTTEVVVS